MNSERFSRQSFLGEDGQAAIERCLVGLVGLGGGGSHIAQQLAHVGFLNYVIFDGDHADESNLNRLVIATEADVAVGRPKVEAARDRILGVRGTARIEAFDCRWQDRPEALRRCDLVFGCVDSFAERSELEASCRRYLIPYIDVGMDLHQAEDEPPVMGGQVILSMPDGPCMFCMGFLNEQKLGREAAQYGAAGDRPAGHLAKRRPGIHGCRHRRRSAHRLDPLAPRPGLSFLPRERQHSAAAHPHAVSRRRALRALPGRSDRGPGVQKPLSQHEQRLHRGSLEAAVQLRRTDCLHLQATELQTDFGQRMDKN